MRDRLGVASPLVRSHSGGVSAASLGGMLPLLVARLGEAILGMVAPSLDLKIDQNGALPLSRSVYYSWILGEDLRGQAACGGPETPV
eukprot:COSAG06_NODE_4098_length_4576_cov_13.778870_2_plen_87_part_00